MSTHDPRDPWAGEAIDAEAAAAEAAYWDGLDHADRYAEYLAELAEQEGEAAGEDDGPDPSCDPTPDGTRPDGLYQAPQAVRCPTSFWRGKR